MTEFHTIILFLIGSMTNLYSYERMNGSTKFDCGINFYLIRNTLAILHLAKLLLGFCYEGITISNFKRYWFNAK